jgi:ribose transport system substrate-binding protein
MLNPLRKRGATRLIAVAAAALMIAGAGCSTGTETTKAKGSTTAATPTGLWKPGDGNIPSLDLRTHALDAVKGKTLAWVPVGLGVPLTDEWTYVMKTRAEALGMKFVVRDPNWDSQNEARVVSSLIAEHPDVLVIHNPDVQLLASQIEQAQKAGIFVVQVNMVSNYKSDAYVGADWETLGSQIGNDIVKTCGQGTSGKVEIIEGPKTSGASLDQLRGAKSVLDQHPEIKIVSDQSGGNWDPTAAHDLASTVLRANPDLCAIYGFWGVMTNGAAQAVKEAGLVGKVKVFSSGGGSPVNCQDLKQGLFHEFAYYDAPLQAQQVVDIGNNLLQSGLKPGDVHWASYTPLQIWTEGQANQATCYTPKVTLP